MVHPTSHMKTAKGNTNNEATLFRLSIASNWSEKEIRFIEKRTSQI
jgi:hypothetical protein